MSWKTQIKEHVHILPHTLYINSCQSWQTLSNSTLLQCDKIYFKFELCYQTFMSLHVQTPPSLWSWFHHFPVPDMPPHICPLSNLLREQPFPILGPPAHFTIFLICTQPPVPDCKLCYHTQTFISLNPIPCFCNWKCLELGGSLFNRKNGFFSSKELTSCPCFHFINKIGWV